MKLPIRQELLPGSILAVLALVAAGAILYTGHDTIFFFDEWDFLLSRRGMSVDTLLDPHGGHLSLVPILIYKALYSTVGMAPYWPYRLLVVLGHLLCAGLVYAIARRRLGPWPALVFPALLLFLGKAWEVLLWPFEITYLCSLAAGLGAWLLLQEQSRARDIGASVLIGVALASSGVGVPVAAGLLAGLLLGEDRRRGWVLAPPLALYAIWLVGWGLSAESHEGLELANLPSTPRYVAGMASTAAGGLIALSDSWGQIVIVVFGSAAAAVLIWRGPPAWLIAAVVTALSFWVLTGLARADAAPSSSSRYIYPSAVFLLLIAVELVAVAPPAWRAEGARRPAVWALAAILVVWAGVGGLEPLRDGGRALRSASAALRPKLAALEIGDGAVDPAMRVQPAIAAGPYLAAVADFGSPLPGGVAAEPPAAVDAALIGAEGLALVPNERAAAGAEPPVAVSELGGSAVSEGGCLRFTPSSALSAFDVQAAPGAALLVRNRGDSPAQVRVRRLAGDFPAAPLATAKPGSQGALSFPRDARRTPWMVRISASEPVAVCSVA